MRLFLLSNQQNQNKASAQILFPSPVRRRCLLIAAIGSFLSRLNHSKKSTLAKQVLIVSAFAAIVIIVLGGTESRDSLRIIMGWGAAEAADTIYQGFGATTPGGSGGEVVHVTNLNDSGPGSLRDAVSLGSRTIVFDVGGEIVLSNHIFVRGAFITIDGFTAPSPGITLKGWGLFIRGIDGAHDVIVRNIRVRNSVNDGMQIKNGAYNVIISHVSIDGSTDENIDITEDSHDVTVAWSILGDPLPTHPKSMLIKYNPSRITLHHNLFKAKERNPQVRIDDVGTPATDTTLDMRNNLIWGWGSGFGHGTLVFYGPWVNIVDNFYSSAGGAVEYGLVVCNEATLSVAFCVGDPASSSRSYVAGNVSGDGLATINDVGNEEGIPFPAPFVDTVDGCTAAYWVLAEAGARPLDVVDQQYVSAINLPACVSDPPTVTISASDATAAEAGAATGAFTVSRTGDTTTALTVNYTVGGTATAGSDYAALLGDVTIPIGFSTAVITVTPVDDGLVEANETVTVTVASNAAYTVGSPSIATVTITDNDGGKDLVIENLGLSLSSVAPGGSTTVSHNVANRGTITVTETYTDRIYLSTDQTYDVADTLLGTSHGHTTDLAPNVTHSNSQAVTIPGGTAPGNYFILVRADALSAVVESNELNNVTAVPLTVPSTFSISGRVTSGGSGLSGVTVALSGTASKTTTTDSIGNYTFTGLVNGAYTVTPSKSGCTFSPTSLSTSIDGSNITGQDFTATCSGGKDLVIENLGVSVSTVASGGGTTVSYNVVNRGTVTVTETYTDRIYLSTDQTFDAADILLGTSHGHTTDLAFNVTHPHSQSVTIPSGTAPGNYFILVRADALGAVSEINELNNVTAAALTVTLSTRDLVIENLSLSLASVAPGGSVTVSHNVANRGTVTVTETYTDRIYLSTDQTFDAADTLLGTSHGHMTDLASNALHSNSQAVTIPVETAPGNYFILVQADALGAVSESNEGNNVTAAGLTVP